MSWSDYRDLLSVNDETQRKRLTQRAEREDWPRETLRREIAKVKRVSPKAVDAVLKEPLLEPQRGIPFTYKIVTLEGRLQIDLGFSNYLLLPLKYANFFKEGTLVQMRTTGNRPRTMKKDSYDLVKFNLPKNRGSWPVELGPLFTYRARVLAITDADTFWAFIDLGFGFTTVQQLRLRGLDAPEIASRDGQAAKKFVEKELKNVQQVIITSTKSDKYDRYLADIFYKTKTGETFLNNELLSHRFAVRV